jgi:tetratricopeptide (TPR) repeat protein
VTDDNVIHVDFGQGAGVRPPPKRILPTEPPPPDAEPPRARDPLADLYTVQEAAALFSVSESRLRYWERSGFLVRSVQTAGKRFYSFQDLIAVRAAKALLDTGVPLQSVRKSLDALQSTLPNAARPLCALRIRAEGQTIVVRDDHGAYEPATGQLRLDFEISALRDDVVRVLRNRDERTYDRAEAAYRRAIELDPTLANAYTNLGNLMFRRGRTSDAESFYLRALQIDPEQPEAFYNLGFMLYDRGDLAASVLNFRRALRSDPSFADAHFNLAMALTELGERDNAKEHWHTYLKLDPHSPWAEVARRHL